jgi:hypothetical protein
METLKGLPKAPLAIFFLVPIGFLIGITARESYARKQTDAERDAAIKAALRAEIRQKLEEEAKNRL